MGTSTTDIQREKKNNEKKERKKSTNWTMGEKVFELIITENFPKLMTDTKQKIQEVAEERNKKDKYPKIYTYDIIFKLQKTEDEEKIF